MRRFRFGRKKARKGIVGIEAAIVLIAFVLVAAALAFVVLNMGMFTAQKSKEVIARAYEESTRALDVAGSVIAKVNTTDKKVVMLSIPIKLTAGARPIDLSKTAVSVLVATPNKSYYFENTLNLSAKVTYTVVTNLSQIYQNLSNSNLQGIKSVWAYARTDDDNKTGDNLLEQGEIALLLVYFNSSEIDVPAYSRIVVEIKPPVGSTITIERVVPPTLTNEFVNLDIG